MIIKELKRSESSIKELLLSKIKKMMYRSKFLVSYTILNRRDGIPPAIDLTIGSNNVTFQNASDTMILFNT